MGMVINRMDAGGVRLRGPTELGERRSSGSLHLVAACLRAPSQARERLEGQGGGRVPPRTVQGALPTPRVPLVLAAQSRQAAVPLAQGALHRSREAPWPSPRRCRQVTRP